MSLSLICVVAPCDYIQVMQLFAGMNIAGVVLGPPSGAHFPFLCPGEVLRGTEPFLSTGVLAAAASLLVS